MACAILLAMASSAYGNATLMLATNPVPPVSPPENIDTDGGAVDSHVVDAFITSKVKAVFFRDPGLKSYEIHVKTNGGRVMLSGTIDTKAEIDRAVELALDIKEVRAVINAMRVKQG